MALNLERLRLRAAGRAEARDFAEMLSITDPESLAAFLDELNDLLKPPKSPEQVKKEQQTISQLSIMLIPRGVHMGKQFDEVPREYLHWWVSSSDEITKLIAEYLELTKGQDDV